MSEKIISIEQIAESDLIRHRAILRVILFTAAPSCLLFTYLNYTNGNTGLAVLDAMLLTASIYLIIKSKTSAHIHLISLCFSIAVFSVVMYAITLRDSPAALLVWVYTIPILAYSTLGKFYGFFTSGIFISISVFQVVSNANNYKIEPDFYDLTHLTISAILSWALVHVYETARANAHAMLLQFSSTDSLTGVNNRVSLEDSFLRISSRSQENGTESGLILIDLDHFKKINDTMGHPCGDEVLRQVAATLTKNTRPDDKVFRIGGEEFCILTTCNNFEHLENVAESIRQRIEAVEVAYDNKKIKVTCSIGAIRLTADENDLTTLLRDADKALYRAKENGRNQVIVA